MKKMQVDTLDDETAYILAKKKAMAILMYMDRTETELRSKLKQAGFKEYTVDRTIEYVKSYHYIDDERYTYNYIKYKKESKSIRQMTMVLKQKGIDREMIEKVLENDSINDTEAILRAIRKKTDHVESLTIEEKQKIAAFLYRKGFQNKDIREYVKY